MIKKIMQVFGFFFVALAILVVFIPVAASAPLPQAVISTPTPGADGRITKKDVLAYVATPAPRGGRSSSR